MSNIPNRYQDDVIDLHELVSTLWKNKLLILVSTTLFSVAGIVYALMAPEQWSSKAEVIAPTPLQVEQLRLRLENIKAVNPMAAQGMERFLATFSEDKLLTDFIAAFKSLDNKREFLETNGYAWKGDKKDASSRKRFLEKVSQKITATIRKKETYYTLAYTADNAQEASKRLNAYINFVQAKEVVTKNQQLKVEIANQSQTLALKRQILKADTLKRLHEEITRTEFALRMSETAGIATPIPVEELNHQNIFPIHLGAKALNEQLKILKEIKDPEIINPELADIRWCLDGLQALPLEIVHFTSYHFLRSPSEPQSPNRPKKSVVVALATLAGLMVGMAVAEFRRHLP